MTEVRAITYEEGLPLVKGERDLIYDRHGEQYGLFVDGKLVSMLSVVEQGKKIKIKAMYTIPSERRKGYSEELLKSVCKYISKPIIAGALEGSVGIFKRLGFRVVKEKQFTRFKIYSVERRSNG